MKSRMALAVIVILNFSATAQNLNSIWCFGDSAGMDFSSGVPSLFTSSVKSRGSSVSVSDSAGHLMFYAFTRATIAGNTTRVFNRDNDLMANGNNIVGEGWYQELVSFNDPGNPNYYYLLSIGVTGSSQTGLYYSVVDMSLDSGRGEVTLKNIQLNNYKACDGIMAIKHGNGRDWWIISKRWDVFNNEFYEYLISPTGITGPNILYAGSASINSWFWNSVSLTGNKFVWINLQGLIELYNFDRCTGSITLQQTISYESSTAPYPFYLGAEFSPNEQLLYVSKYTDSMPDYPSYLIQYDLNAANIFASADTLWNYHATPVAAGKLKLAPDGKIYFSCIYHDGINFPYPYPDSVFNQVNNNLSVINYPDSPGVACDFQPFSFNLGAGRCYIGLPNNPDYELGPDTTSLCDTVLQAGNLQLAVVNESHLHVFYHREWQIAFINTEGLKGRRYALRVFDLMGKEIYQEEGVFHPPYFTKDLRCDDFADGMYVVHLETDAEVLGGKFVKE